MNQIGKIKIRDLKELQGEATILSNNALLTPMIKRKNLKSILKSKNLNVQKSSNEIVTDYNITVTTTPAKDLRKNVLKSFNNETPANQKRIDTYFTSCPKTYDITFRKEEPKKSSLTNKVKFTGIKSRSVGNIRKCTKSTSRTKQTRKRLFSNSTKPSAEIMSGISTMTHSALPKPVECITIDSDSEDDRNTNESRNVDQTHSILNASNPKSTTKKRPASIENILPMSASSLSFGQTMNETSCETIGPNSISPSCNGARRKTKICPSYKIIEDTSFSVDAFQFGYIENVTHYFLTHFHADHYIGLTKSFAMPIYVSPITARLLRVFIKVQEEYIHELELNQSYIVNGIEITALDANHCPGSILLVFKFPRTGKCILHTGDFRASHEMESEPIFWNNDIHTIYLDTTYISDKYAFCTQYESIIKAQDLIEKFLGKHAGKRVLYICGSYVIGKEKFWSALAETYHMKVWAEGNRYKALNAINDERFNRLLVNDPNEANMHVISMAKLSYLKLTEYFKMYEQHYDVLFAIRPSGWEKDSKPRYGSKINLIGIEYSEHSSYEEMQRFVKFLKPEQVISTVPSGKDISKTSNVPLSWYKYDKLKASSKYQPSIESFLSKTPKNKMPLRMSNIHESMFENFVSLSRYDNLSLINLAVNDITINLDQDEAISALSSKPADKNESKQVLNRSSTDNSLKLHNHENKSRTKNEISVTNSSDDFEKLDTAITTKKTLRNGKKLLEKNNSKTSVSTNVQRVRKQLRNGSQFKNKEQFETIDGLQQMKNKLRVKWQEESNEIKTDNEKTTNINSVNYFYEDEINNIHNLETLNASVRLTRSQTNSTYKLTNTFATDSTSAHIIKPSDKTITLQALDSDTNVRRVTRSKSGLTETSNSYESQHKLTKNFNSKHLKPSEQNSKIVNSNFKLLQSTIESTVDPISVDEMDMKALKDKDVKMNTLVNSENCLNELDYRKKPNSSKRNVSDYEVAHFKRNKSSIDTNTIVNTILKQREDIDRFNCSQKAGLMLETINKENPDSSKDRIPVDLLSDADDDWM